MQRDIDSFKMMQDGLRPVSRTDQDAQQGSSTNPSATDQRTSEMGDPALDGLTSSASGLKHSIVSGEATWEGKLRTEASARIEGTISGEIDAGETVFIASGANVRANVHARRVIIAGALEGQITCREQLVVQQSGRLAGKVSTETLVIEEGAIVQSQIQMLRRNEPIQAIAKDSILWEDTIASALDKPNGQRLNSGQAGSSDQQPIELQTQTENVEE